MESVYEEALAWELSEAGLVVRRQLDVPIRYKSQTLTTPLRLDLLVQNKVIVECKATSRYHDVFEAQTLTYLRINGSEAGPGSEFWREINEKRISPRREQLVRSPTKPVLRRHTFL